MAGPAETVTVGSVVASASATLAAAGCDTPRLDAELLLASAMGVTRTTLFLTPAAVVPASAATAFESLVGRRARREPVAYILGVKHFRRLELVVDERVLIPRPETAVLVEACVDALAQRARVADVGTGSGAVALALKDERPDLSIVGIDVSLDAVAVARGNAERLGLDVEFAVGDLLGDHAAAFDAVVANLPYVCAGDPLPPEVAVFEPGDALFAGADGLDLIRRLTASLEGPSLVALEHGFGQADAVAALVSVAGFRKVSRFSDLAGISRVVVGQRR